MTAVVKNIVATGLSSGLGFESLKQLLQQSQPYRVILGTRNTQSTTAAIDALDFNRSASAVSVLPLELSDLNTVKMFSSEALGILGQDKIDYLYMNAGLAKDATLPAPNGSKWCEALVVNHTSQHYLVHLLREKLIFSKSRLVFVSSGAICSVTDPSRSSLSFHILVETHIIRCTRKDLNTPSNAKQFTIYSESKFVHFLGAQWWRRKLANQCRVVAVSPGLIPGTGLSWHSKESLPTNHPDAKSIPEGAASLNTALFRDDFPEDPEHIFLTSWAEWWGKDAYAKALDKTLQNKWCWSKEEIEKQKNVTA